MAVSQELLGGGGGRFFRGNLHCHSDRSDGHWSPEDVVAAYREAGYDFIVLSDHFEARYGWRITDTRHLRDERFTTIVGAELSSAPWDDRHCYWVVAAGLPVDFSPPSPGDHAEAITRARECGAFVTLLHPGLNNLPLAACDTLPAFEAVHAVEIYNHTMAVGAATDRASGAYVLDGLLEQGCRLLVTAGDDAHFARPDDRFGAWVEVAADRLEPDALLAALKAGRYYSTQGPALRELRVEGDRLHVKTSDVHTIGLTGGGDRWQCGTERTSEPGATIAEAEFDLTPFRGAYCRVVAIDGSGKRAWSNPIWP
jgi:histidinol phosphatase-like PHP family hydrolase